jgi:hypothetical protein
VGAWLRRPPSGAWAATCDWWAEIRRDRSLVRNGAAALKGVPWILRERRVVSRDVEQTLRTLARFYAANEQRRAQLPVATVEQSEAS